MNNMNCNLETGICGVNEESSNELINFNHQNKKVTLYYFTDPICSHCWALEPVLNRFLIQYGHYFKFKTVLGGLLPGWNGFADRSNGIQKPADVADHWKEVGIHSRMPIDGTLWHDNPIQSSYPATRVFKVIQDQTPTKAHDFLRQTREAVFAFNKNVGDNQVLIDIVNQISLDGESVIKTASEDRAYDLMEEDFDLARNFGVSGFPTIIIINEDNTGLKVVGAQKLESYVSALSKVLDDTPIPAEIPTLQNWVDKNSWRYFSKEIETMYDLSKDSVFSFVKKSLNLNQYNVHEILGEMYIKKK